MTEITNTRILMEKELAAATRVAPGPQPWIDERTGRRIRGWSGGNRAMNRRRHKARCNVKFRHEQRCHDKAFAGQH